MSYLDLFKQGVSLVIGAGVSQIVTGVVNSTTPQEQFLQKGLVFAGRTGITMLVSDAVRDHVDVKIDMAAAWISSNVVSPVKSAK